MLGLFAAHRSGTGHAIESAMIVSNLYLNYADAFSYEGKAPRPPVDKRQLGTGATHRLYECASVADSRARAAFENPDPHWVMLAADDDAAFARFCAAVERGDLAADPRFATEQGRAEHRAELEEELVPVFLSRAAQAWEARLLAADVGCIVADDLSHFAFLYEDPQAQAVGMMTQVSHPSLGGKYWRYAPVIALSDTPARALPFCDLGEYTRALLAELGYADTEVDQLLEDGVVAATP
jgi:crotonobetainyl-CoA:carnitine CoA-transferase CaiB-like acyl-CoA transferase